MHVKPLCELTDKQIRNAVVLSDYTTAEEAEQYIDVLLRRQKQRHMDLCAAYRDEMEAISGTLNGGPYHEGASLAARHILNLIENMT